ncbi:MAG: PatB family C-S lyase, partial [Deltaproteobacteria bacterium]|nr:PatB family C-S lyase [Deltaproteobacteria bacterium]MBW2051605.1 PatB family C-S lyase [Deltaproteobacteria bacterium]
MKYDFDRVIDRTNTNSAKWDAVEQLFGDKDVLPMWVADMDFQVPTEVIEALKKKAGHGIFGYTFKQPSYYEPFLNWMEKRHGWQIKKEWLTYSPGVVTSLILCVLALTQPGDKVILQPPVYYPFFRVILNNGRQVVNNPLKFENGRYYMDLDDLEKRAGGRTRLMILSSPHNPVGRLWEKEELVKLGEFCVKNDIVLISDEVHSDLVYTGHKHIPTASISEEISLQTITCVAPSKTFNLAGLKSSVIIISDPKLRNQYNVMLGNLGIGMDNSFGLEALKSAYQHGEEWLKQLLEYLQQNMEFTLRYFEEKIPEIKVIKPEATYLLWLDCRKLGFDNKGLKEFMIKKAKVGLDDGPPFGPGGEGFQRINIACPRATLEEGL